MNRMLPSHHLWGRWVNSYEGEDDVSIDIESGLPVVLPLVSRSESLDDDPCHLGGAFLAPSEGHSFESSCQLSHHPLDEARYPRRDDAGLQPPVDITEHVLPCKDQVVGCLVVRLVHELLYQRGVCSFNCVNGHNDFNPRLPL